MEQNPLEYGYTLLAQEQVDAVCVQCYQKRMHAAARQELNRRQFAVLEELLQGWLPNRSSKRSRMLRSAAETKNSIDFYAMICYNRSYQIG